MVTTKQMNIRDRTYYLYNDLINIKVFDPNLSKLNRNIDVYYIGSITEKINKN